MSMPTELDRLAAARPACVENTESLVSRAAEDEILRSLLSTARSPATGGARHRIRAGLAVTGAAGLAAACALAAVTVSRHVNTVGPAPAAAQHSALTLQTVAYRSSAAVSGAVADGILYVDTSYPPGTVTGNVARIQAWIRGMSDREVASGPTGALVMDASAVVSHGERSRRFVDYSDRTWQIDSIAVTQAGAPPDFTTAIDTILGLPAATDGRSPGSAPSGPQRVITNVTVNGRALIKVTATWPSQLVAGYLKPLWFAGPEFEPGGTGQGKLSEPLGSSIRSETVWIDVASYLPVRIVATDAGGRVIASQGIAVLPATKANLSQFVPAPVPAGFHLTASAAH